MGTPLSENYISIRSEVRGSRKLDPLVVNSLLREYRKKLEIFKIEETKSDGGLLKIWVQEVDEFNSELLDEGKTLLFSHQLKINIFDSLPHGFDNHAHRLQAKMGEALEKIQIKEGKYSQKIIITTTGIKFRGGERTSGRWPKEQLAGLGI